jgi:hypothetical protein
MSFPKGALVNDGISAENTSVCYATMSDAICLIKHVGHGCYYIKNAFRIMPIHPKDYHLLGMKWRGIYYYRFWGYIWH